MTPRKKWAPDWKTSQQPTRENSEDAFWAEFEDASGKSVQVRITAQDLKEFGQAPPELERKGHHTEQVLRAILETYVEKHGKAVPNIDAQDLGYDITILKRKFAEDC